MFLPRLTALLAGLESQHEAFGKGADLMAGTLAGDGLVHLFGSGHSVIPVMEAFPRYGSFAGLNPLIDPRLAWWEVLGPGGVQELLWLERTEGYIGNFLGHRPVHDGDVLIVFSHGGRNAAPVEAAMIAQQRGARVIGITSRANLARPAGHSSGQRLADLADVVIDTGVPAEDALVTVDGWGAPVGGASTIVACSCMTELLTRTAARLAARGVTLPTFVCPTAQGATPATNDEVFAAHRERVLRAAARGGVSGGGVSGGGVSGSSAPGGAASATPGQ
jgi:uncharacterized phosphosugar-binding protein